MPEEKIYPPVAGLRSFVGARRCLAQKDYRKSGPRFFVGAGPCACPVNGKSQKEEGQPRGVAPTLSLPDIVHRFKSLTTTRYKHGVIEFNWPPFPGKLWQRNYYEHIIRNEDELNRLREYIIKNPMQWEMDNEHPDRIEQPVVGAGPCACPS